MDQLVDDCFKPGLSQRATVALLAEKMGIFLTDRNLRRIWRRLNLTRRKQYSNIDDVRNYIQYLIAGSDRICGYRWLHSKLILQGFQVRFQDVRLLLKTLDSAGIVTRQRRRLRRREYFAKGPNFLWHMDGYDKLKPYRICISGCIDGFSRYVLWLEAHCTNNDPDIIAGYFIETLRKNNICPFLLRADHGTENVVVKVFQQFLHRFDDHQGERSFLVGRSTANQRIESWWGQLRRHSAQYWMDALQELKDAGEFTGSLDDKSIVQYCFMDLIQESLNDVVNVWNFHHIRKSKNQRVPHGKPYVLYNCPEAYARTHECGVSVTADDLDNCVLECKFRNGNPCVIPGYKTLFDLYMQENNWLKPSTCEEAIDLYMKLKNKM